MKLPATRVENLSDRIIFYKGNRLLFYVTRNGEVVTKYGTDVTHTACGLFRDAMRVGYGIKVKK